VTARYWVLATRELLHAGPRWEDAGLRQVGFGGWQDRHTRWVLIEDPGAPPELDGKEVELTFSLIDGKPQIADRQIVSPPPQQ
jgi:hypothetical protein